MVETQGSRMLADSKKEIGKENYRHIEISKYNKFQVETAEDFFADSSGQRKLGTAEQKHKLVFQGHLQDAKAGSKKDPSVQDYNAKRNGKNSL